MGAGEVTGAAVSACGLIGFVGLIVPHAVRLAIGPDHRRLVPGSALAGATFLVLADTFARTVRVPEIPLGSLAGTGRTATAVPFVAAGWAGGFVAGAPGGPSDGVRPVVGLGIEWPLDLLRLDVGVSPRTGRIGVAIDISRDFWDIL